MKPSRTEKKQGPSVDGRDLVAQVPSRRVSGEKEEKPGQRKRRQETGGDAEAQDGFRALKNDAAAPVNDRREPQDVGDAIKKNQAEKDAETLDAAAKRGFLHRKGKGPMNFLQKAKPHLPFLVLMLGYVVFNLMTLTKFPRVFSDEGYLTNFVALLKSDGFPIITRPLSDSGPLQNLKNFPLSGFLFFASFLPLTSCFGFGLFAVRLQPFLFSLVALLLAHRLGSLLFGDRPKALLACFCLALAPQFLSAAHLVRQEPMMVSCLLGVFVLALEGVARKKAAPIYLSALLSSLAVSVHPNGVIAPLVLIVFLFARRKELPSSLGRLLPGIVLSGLAGGLVVFFLDYLPYRKYFWDAFNSPQVAPLTHRSFSVPLPTLIREHVAGIWSYFWDQAYHRFAPYLLFDLAAVAGAVFLPSRPHRILLTAIGLIHLCLIPLRPSPFYLAYLAPFYSLLGASVLTDLFRGRAVSRLIPKPALAAAVVVFLAGYSLNAVLTAWMFRKYDHARLAPELSAVLSPDARAFVSPHLFFLLPPKNAEERALRADYYRLLATHDLKTITTALRLNYVVVDPFSRPWIDPKGAENLARENGRFLENECRRVLSVYDVLDPSAARSDKEGEISVYECGAS